MIKCLVIVRITCHTMRVPVAWVDTKIAGGSGGILATRTGVIVLILKMGTLILPLIPPGRHLPAVLWVELAWNHGWMWGLWYLQNPEDRTSRLGVLMRRMPCGNPHHSALLKALIEDRELLLKIKYKGTNGNFFNKWRSRRKGELLWIKTDLRDTSLKCNMWTFSGSLFTQNNY